MISYLEPVFRVNRTDPMGLITLYSYKNSCLTDLKESKKQIAFYETKIVPFVKETMVTNDPEL